MSVNNPAYRIPRMEVSLIGTPEAEAAAPEYVKMFDPPKESPPTPERLAPTNPVPEVMEALGLGRVDVPRTVNMELLNGVKTRTYDNAKELQFFTFRERDFVNRGTWPGPTLRVPRGSIFHCQAQGNSGPHTIHWHGLEPTPINDGVGHTSMEIGSYLYQFQPNHIGSYFYHCHRNTMQHFEFGLYGFMVIEPPDAYFASIIGSNWRTGFIPGNVQLNAIPIGACTDGRFRTACNLLTLPATVRNRFPGFVGGDPVYGVAGRNQTLEAMNPWAFTVPYDVEAVWVFDDRDSVWSDLADNHAATFPAQGLVPGVDDNFRNSPGRNGFFAFNDFNADYWFVTGVPVPTARGGTATINPPAILPPELNGGKGARGVPRNTGTQVAVDARVGETILIRCLDAAYNKARITFPVDVVIIAWDGRALGVPPFGNYNQAFVLPKNTPYTISTARRFDALVNSAVPVPNSSVKVEFLETRGNEVTATALIPFSITT